MEKKTIKLSYFECVIILISGIFIAFKEILLGTMLMPMVAEQLGPNSIGTACVALAIVVEAVLIIYFALKLTDIIT